MVVPVNQSLWGWISRPSSAIEQEVFIDSMEWGIGISYSKDPSLTIENYADLLQELIIQMDEKYPIRQLSLLGMSWGRVSNTKVANQVLAKINGIIAYGQTTIISL